ncbi:MAG TPA: hypothetical protein VJS20_12640 [Gemmatimonadales bacterium]|nr:hypothetical protein [Gemmatimonadales bacterium]
MKVPIVFTQPPPEFGELQMSPEFHDESAMSRDFTYVPGFSELRRQRDEAIVEVLQGKRSAKDVPTLPHNFRWARCQTKAGEPDNRKVIRAGNRGYKAVTKDDVGEGKLLKELPAGASISADGTIRQGDTQLMIASADRVARNEFTKRAKTESSIKGAEAGFNAALKEFGVAPVQGAAPFIEKQVGHRVRAELTPKPK